MADPALVLYLPMDEGRGDTVKDLSQNGNNGTLEGNPKWVEGKFGKALEFSGGSRVHISASRSLHGDIQKDTFTFAAWLKPTLTGDEWQHIWRTVDSKDQSQDTLFLNTGGFFSWRGQLAGQWDERCVTPGGIVKANEWTHVAVVGDKKDFKIYVNGAEAASSPFVEQDGGMSDAYLAFDNRQWAEKYSGVMDEVYFLARALTADEINDGVSRMLIKVLSVYPAGKLAATWGHVKGSQ